MRDIHSPENLDLNQPSASDRISAASSESRGSTRLLKAQCSNNVRLKVTKLVTPRLLRIKDAAAYLAASPSKVRDLIRDGKLRLALDPDDDPEKTPWKVTQDDLDAYINGILQTKGFA